MTKQSLVLLRSVIEGFKVFARNDQHVRRGLRINIANDDAAVVLINYIARGVAVDYFAEKAILFAHVLGVRLADNLANFQ